MLPLAGILVAALASGRAAQKVLRPPCMIGELGAGILVGPFALCGFAWPWAGPLLQGSAAPVSSELQAFSTVAAVLLLSSSCLEADRKAFLAHSLTSPRMEEDRLSGLEPTPGEG